MAENTGTTKIEQLIEDIYEFVEESRSPLGNSNKVILQRAELYDMLDLVCLGTIADVVPLLGENRMFVSVGLEVI